MLFTKKYFPYLLIFPASLIFILFVVAPIISSFSMSFFKYQGIKANFIFLNNYIRLFQDAIFLKSIANIFFILIIQVPIMIILSIMVAVMLNNPLLKLRGFFRVSFFLPTVTSLIAYSIIFFMLLQQEGIINSFLKSIGLSPIPWLRSEIWSKISLIIALTWRWTGYNMVIFLAALQNIPDMYYEAASIDGASKFRQFWSITLPQLKPVILFSSVMSTIGTLQLFDEPFALTGGGGPSDATITPILYMYKNAFSYFDIGYGAAIAYTVVLIIALLSFIQSKILGQD